MNIESIFFDIKNSFSGIWSTKQRGKSLEIITPYATTNNRFVSVFLLQRDGVYIITDGGWINSGMYDNNPFNDESCFQKVLFHFQNAYDVKETNTPNKSNHAVSHYYVKATSQVDIASKIFDLATFIQNVASVSQITFEDKEEKETKERFVSLANDYIKSIVTPEQIKFNSYLNAEKKEIKFNAIYYRSNNEITLLNYVTGSTVSYFSNSIFKANTLFEMADESIYSGHVRNKIALVDTNASGFVKDKIAHYLIHLQKHTGTQTLEWVYRDKLASIL
ncbi:hypothetical protein MQE36_05800 [Zhouia spongiae]|uniref:DUF1828 domain-containing protein n=1 Tax=Zhouia spongiae TaxID=2202721 RepID=A0ABY3YQ03_9FLAO|nr:hypothetical protein [Zhouia spongiae]UNY99859.1 hypothetical protein MQE36_05800 [Zhouia spongiae]